MCRCIGFQFLVQLKVFVFPASWGVLSQIKRTHLCVHGIFVLPWTWWTTCSLASCLCVNKPIYTKWRCIWNSGVLSHTNKNKTRVQKFTNLSMWLLLFLHFTFLTFEPDTANRSCSSIFGFDLTIFSTSFICKQAIAVSFHSIYKKKYWLILLCFFIVCIAIVWWSFWHFIMQFWLFNFIWPIQYQFEHARTRIHIRTH